MSWYYRISNQPSPLTQAQMEANVEEIYAQLYANYLWTVNAICAVLGNMQYESYLNPAQTELYQPIDSEHWGYGLMQWTPASKIKNWLRNNNHSLYSGYWQCNYLETVTSEWIENQHHPEYIMTYEQFKHSGESVDFLTKSFFYNYVRGTWDDARTEMADDWYRYLMGTDPPEPSPDPPTPIDPPDPVDPDPHGYVKPFKTILFMKNRHNYPR